MTLRPESDIAANWMKLAADLEARNLAQRMENERLRKALTLAANRLDMWCIAAIADGNEALRCKTAIWVDEARTALEAHNG